MSETTDAAHREAAKDVLNATTAMRHIHTCTDLSVHVRLHYLRTVRIHLNQMIGDLRGDDDELPPVLAAKFGDVMHDIHRSAMEIDQ